MIIPVYQPLGASTHRIAQAIGDHHQTKATHTGTLDPMAEGVIIILTDQDRFLKSQLSDWQKTYEFSILWGISTDTHDLLGLIDQDGITANEPKTDLDHSNAKLLSIASNATNDRTNQANNVFATQIQSIQTSLLGKQRQQIPDFSAKRSSKIQYSDITIFDFQHIETHSILASSIIEQLQYVIPKLANDFRQHTILQQWQNWMTHLPARFETPLVITHHRAITSKRTYIRGIVRDISQQLAIPATTFHIKRTQNGNYTAADCICLV